MKRQTFSDITGSGFYNQPISIRCRVSGRSVVPYCVPKVLVVKCQIDNCIGCQFAEPTEIVIVPGDERILYFLDVPSQRLAGVVRSVLKITCKKFLYDVKEMQNVERIFISQTGSERSKGEQARKTYYIGYGLEVNVVYDMHGYSTVDPMTQEVTHVFTECKKVRSDVESFALTSTLHDELNEFCQDGKSADDMMTHLEDIYHSYAYNVTKIYGRFDLHLSIDLVFRSVLSFKFDRELIHKGWMDMMVIGDTRCGKGFVAEKLVEYFGVGEVISADNVSYAGLVAGLQQFSKHWVVTWGKLPMNDCGLVVVDESSELKPEDWTRLSRIRSEGLAEVTKIQSQVTNARTRLIFLGNPPQKIIANYSYGIQSVLEVVKAPEDIARFDYVLVLGHNEVKMEDINVTRDPTSFMYPRQLERDLIFWTWSRAVDQILFTDDAIKYTYDRAIELGRLYDFSIPLIQGENVRVKLARLAVAFAARFYSHRDKGRLLRVERNHVECAWIFLNMIYRKEPSGYFAFSQMKKMTDEQNMKKNLQVVETYINSFHEKRRDVYKCLLANNSVSVNDLIEHLNVDRVVATELISTLLRSNCIIKRGLNFYIKTASFTRRLKHILFGKLEHDADDEDAV